MKNFLMKKWGLGIGDWGLGIGDWANPQSPFLSDVIFIYILFYQNVKLIQ